MKPSDAIHQEVVNAGAEDPDRRVGTAPTDQHRWLGLMRWLDANWPPPAPPQDAEAERLISEFEDAVRSLPGITSLGGGCAAARTALLSYIAGLRRQIALLEADAPEGKL